MAGQNVALIGPSGCGKTTVMKIILGLLKPSMGAVYIDDVNIEDLCLNAYRKHLGSVNPE